MKNLLAYKTKGWAKNNKSIRSATNYSNSDSIGLLFTIDDKAKHNAIKAFIKQLEADGKIVQALAFLPEKKENHEFLFDFFTKKDISFWGNYRSELVESFAKKPFDYLIHLDFECSDILKGVLAQSKAKCRVGGPNADQSTYYELMVAPKDKNIQSLIDEMYRYVSILKS